MEPEPVKRGLTVTEPSSVSTGLWLYLLEICGMPWRAIPAYMLLSRIRLLALGWYFNRAVVLRIALTVTERVLTDL